MTRHMLGRRLPPPNACIRCGRGPHPEKDVWTVQWGPAVTDASVFYCRRYEPKATWLQRFKARWSAWSTR